MKIKTLKTNLRSMILYGILPSVIIGESLESETLLPMYSFKQRRKV